MKESRWHSRAPKYYQNVASNIDKAVSSWLHIQCSDWARITNGANKTAKSKESWKHASFFSMKLGDWAGESFRILPMGIIWPCPDFCT